MLMLCALLAATPPEKLVVGEVRVFDPTLTALGAQTQEQLATELTRLERFDVVTSSDLAALLGMERQRQLLGCGEDSASCLGEMGAALGAPWLVSASLGLTGTKIRFDLKLIDTARGNVVLRDGGETSRAELSVLVRSAVEHIDAKFSPRSARLPPRSSLLGPIITLSAGVAAAGAGFGWLATVPSQRQALQASVTGLTANLALQRQRELQTQSTVALVLGLAGSAGALAGLVWWLVLPRSGVTTTWLAPTSDGVRFGGLW